VPETSTTIIGAELILLATAEKQEACADAFHSLRSLQDAPETDIDSNSLTTDTLRVRLSEAGGFVVQYTPRLHSAVFAGISPSFRELFW